MKVLFIATVTEHIKAFHLPYLRWFKEQGWEVHVAAYGDDEIPYCDRKHNISVQRSPFRLSNIKAYFQLKAVLKNEKYDIIHGHTPMGGVLTRLCGKKHRKNGTRVIYSAHGFHFYKGAPVLNWLLYYPMERWLSKHTDTLITTNHEDYELAKRKMKAKNIYYVPGVGVDTGRFASAAVDRESKRSELGIPADATVLISVGELNKNKNHEVMIKAVAALNKPGVHYCIVGKGGFEPYLKKLSAAPGINVRLLGYRTDIADLLHMADIFVFPSLREGLSVSLMEAMAAGLPCVVSGIRGNVDLIEHSKGGFTCGTADIGGYVDAVKKIMKNPELKKNMGEYNKTAVQGFSLAVVMEKLKEIYGICGENGI